MSNKRDASAASNRERQNEKDARNELFAGKEEIYIDPTEARLEDQTVEQLVNTAARTHKDTTAVAERALKVVQESQQIQVETMRKLESQNKAMNNISEKMDEMNEELTYAEKLLSYMRRCCCCWVCDSCTGADPEEQRKQDWRRRVDTGNTRVEGSSNWGAHGANGPGAATGAGADTAATARRRTGGSDTGGGAAGRGEPDIRLPTEHRSTEMKLHEETRRQNDMIDQIHQGLEQLLEGAKVMTDELSVQNKQLDVLDDKTAATQGRLDDVNKNSQLRNLARSKPKKSKKDEGLGAVLPTKTSLAVAAAKRLAAL